MMYIHNLLYVFIKLSIIIIILYKKAREYRDWL